MLCHPTIRVLPVMATHLFFFLVLQVATSYEFQTTVADGKLKVVFTFGAVNNPKVNGIEVIPLE